jgi:hypothetical protein
MDEMSGSTTPENTEERGFSSTFIDPYFGSNARTISATLDAMRNAHLREVIVGWSAYHSPDSSSVNIVTAYDGALIAGAYRGASFTTSTFNTFVLALLEQAGLRNIYGCFWVCF